MPKMSRFAVILSVLVAGVVFAGPADAQTNQNSGFAIGPIHKGLVVGAVVGVAAVVGIGVTLLVIHEHHRGVVEGCVAESGGKKTLVSKKRKYLLVDGGPALPAGERVKVKGRQSGSAPTRSLEVEKVLKNYGRCPT